MVGESARSLKLRGSMMAVSEEGRQEGILGKEGAFAIERASMVKDLMRSRACAMEMGNKRNG